MSTLGTIAKAGRVLELFTPAQPEWGVTEVARTLDIPKSSAHALLGTLAGTGLLNRTDGNRYRVGWRVLALSRTLLDSSDVRVHAQPTIQALAEHFGTTVHLATLDDGEVTYIDKLEGTRVASIAVSAVGRRLAPHCTALGKVLLAHRPWSEAEAILRARGLRRYTARTICSIEDLREELRAIRARGWACADEEIVEGLSCYAAPIFDEGALAVAAISISITAEEARAHGDRYARLAVAAGARATRSLRSAGAGWLHAAA